VRHRRGIVGLLPAAGRGQRMGGTAHKELAELNAGANMPICSYSLQAMAPVVSRVIVVVSPRKEAIREVLGSGAEFGVELTYVVQEEPHGLPHAIACAREALGDEEVVFAMPDTIFLPRDAVAQLQRDRQEKAVDVALGVFPTDSPWQLAPVDIDQAGRVRAVYDKPRTTPLRNTWGVLAWSPRFSDLCCEYERQRLDASEGKLTDVIERARCLGLPLGARVFSDGVFCDAGTPAGLAAARALWTETVVNYRNR
jgi:glucose-1-phosphate thymidylyltransferase